MVMKKLYLKFLIFLSLITNQAFAVIDTWGNINAHQRFPETEMEINTLAEEIAEGIAYNRSVGHGTYEDIVSFNFFLPFNPNFTESDYESIVSNTLKGAPYAAYILFDISRLSAQQLSESIPHILKLQNQFEKLKNFRFGLRFKYSKEKDHNAAIMSLFKRSPQKYSEIDFDGEWADFINDAAKDAIVWAQISDVDFVGANTISINEKNIKTFIKLLTHLKKLRGVDLTAAVLKEHPANNPKEAKKRVVAALMTELGQHPLLSFIKLSANNLDEQSATLLAINVIQKIENLVLIDVSHNRFGGQGGHDFLKSLAKHKYLNFVSIASNNFHAEHAEDYAKVLEGKASISYLDASYNYFAVEGSYKISLAMSHPLWLQSLQITKYRKNFDIYKSRNAENHLNFKWGGLYFDDFGENYFVSGEKLDAFYKFPKSFKYLYLDANNLNLSPFSELTQSLISANLIYLDLSSNNLSTKNVSDVIKILYFSPLMTGVNLENNAFVGSDMHKIAKALTSFPVLKYVTLSNNDFNAEGIKVLANYLTKDRDLRRLYLSNIELSNGAAIPLFNALNAQKNLEVLDISFNDVDESGVKILLKSLENKKKFNTLRLIGNKFDCNDIKELNDNFTFRCE